MPSAKRLLFLLLVVVPIAAWFIVKPVRVIAPSIGGISCPTQFLCVDDPSKAEPAMALYKDALHYVSDNIGPLDGSPRFIFCFHEKCANYFGLGDRSAVTLGGFGTVIRHRAWKPYYVRHELIHRLQVQHYGTVGMLLKPSWFIEGMAYSLSQDPRHPLAEPWESYRTRFQQWQGSAGMKDVWRHADRL